VKTPFLSVMLVDSEATSPFVDFSVDKSERASVVLVCGGTRESFNSRVLGVPAFRLA
jgi:hypothetical protein